MIKSLALFLEDKIPELTVGVNFFAGFRPQKAPDSCVVLLETAGGESNYYVRDLEFLHVQVVVRGRTLFEARNLARKIHAVLHGVAGVTVGISPTFYFVGGITAISIPQYIGQDDNRRFEMSTNYRVAYYKTTGS